MKKSKALTATLLLGLGAVSNETHSHQTVPSCYTQDDQNLTDTTEQYLYDLKNELQTLNKLNSKSKLSPQSLFFLMYYTQKITELEMLLAKHKASIHTSSSKQLLSKLHIAIQLKIDEIELLKTQAHLNINDTNIIGL